MEARKPLAYFLGENPLRAMEWPLWSFLLFAGLWLLSPWYDPGMAEGSNGQLIRTVASDGAFLVYGGLVAIIGALGMAGLVFGKAKLRKWAAHLLFFVFLYFTILRITLEGLENLAWITYVLNVLFAAAIILRIRWEELNRDGTPN